MKRTGRSSHGVARHRQAASVRSSNRSGTVLVPEPARYFDFEHSLLIAGKESP